MPCCWNSGHIRAWITCLWEKKEEIFSSIKCSNVVSIPVHCTYCRMSPQLVTIWMNFRMRYRRLQLRFMITNGSLSSVYIPTRHCQREWQQNVYTFKLIADSRINAFSIQSLIIIKFDMNWNFPIGETKLRDFFYASLLNLFWKNKLF